MVFVLKLISTCIDNIVRKATGVQSIKDKQFCSLSSHLNLPHRFLQVNSLESLQVSLLFYLLYTLTSRTLTCSCYYN